MTSTRIKARARRLAAEQPGTSYTSALRQVQAGTAPAESPQMWLAGIYERNALGTMWLPHDVLSLGTTRYASRAQVVAALGLDWDGEEMTSTDRTVVKKALAGLPRVELMNPDRLDPLTVFVRRVRHLEGTALATFAGSDEHDLDRLLSNIVPATDAVAARAALHQVIADERQAPTSTVEDAIGDLLADSPLDRQTDQAADYLDGLVDTLDDEFRGYWYSYIGGRSLGALHVDTWLP